MQKLITTIEHKRNTQMLVDGTVVKVDGVGVIEVNDELAKKILQNTAWEPLTDIGAAGDALKARTKTPKTKAERIAEHKAQSKVTLADGTELPANEAKTPIEQEAEDIEKSMREENNPGWPEPGSDEYPDPSIDLPIETLQRMCDDYKVGYTQRTKPATLVKKLTAVMYE